MQSDAAAPDRETMNAGRSGLLPSYALSYGVAALLLGSLVHFGGVWNVLANTRLLDLLISSGIIRYHDLDLGAVDGLPDLELYRLAQDPVDWLLVAVVVGLYFLFWSVRALKFHGIARHLGMDGSMADHARAFFYGVGLNILAPFRLGNAAIVESCEASGESRELAGSAVYTQEMFVLLEIAAFALLGLVLNGWTTWLGEIFWALVIFGTAYFILKPAQAGGTVIPGRATPEDRQSILRGLAERPHVLAGLVAVSLFAFLIDDFTPYLISQAFTGDVVILNVPFSVIQMGVVSGYIARQVAVTPGGIGQFEWGFAAALYMGGVGMPEAATIALLESVVRHGTALLLFAGVVVWKGAWTDLGSVVPEVEPIAAAGAEAR